MFQQGPQEKKNTERKSRSILSEYKCLNVQCHSSYCRVVLCCLSQSLTYFLATRTTEWKSVLLFLRCDQVSVQPQQDCVVSLSASALLSGTLCSVGHIHCPCLFTRSLDRTNKHIKSYKLSLTHLSYLLLFHRKYNIT